jgi:hypothetical protein
MIKIPIELSKKFQAQEKRLQAAKLKAFPHPATPEAGEFVQVRREDLDIVLNAWKQDRDEWNKDKLLEWKESRDRLKAALAKPGE